MASQHEIDSVIEATDIVALVSEYVKLEKTGKNYKGLCPFHNEDTPSFVVSPEKRLAHCFGCGGGGSPIKFLQDIEHIDLPDQLDEKVTRERNVTLSFNIYSNTHDDAYEKAKQMRRWFENRSAEFCDEHNIAFASISDVTNRTTFLIDSYDEKYGFDVIVRYNDVDQYEIDYFDKVEHEIIIERE